MYFAKSVDLVRSQLSCILIRLCRLGQRIDCILIFSIFYSFSTMFTICDVDVHPNMQIFHIGNYILSAPAFQDRDATLFRLCAITCIICTLEHACNCIMMILQHIFMYFMAPVQGQAQSVPLNGCLMTEPRRDHVKAYSIQETLDPDKF